MVSSEQQAGGNNSINVETDNAKGISVPPVQFTDLLGLETPGETSGLQTARENEPVLGQEQQSSAQQQQTLYSAMNVEVPAWSVLPGECGESCPGARPGFRI